MRQVTKIVTGAFLNKTSKSCGNTRTDGTGLFLHGNKIAEWRDGALWITNAGWFSVTTKERLNALPGVSIFQKAGQWYLNNGLWDGKWTMVQPAPGS